MEESDYIELTEVPIEEIDVTPIECQEEDLDLVQIPLDAQLPEVNLTTIPDIEQPKDLTEHFLHTGSVSIDGDLFVSGTTRFKNVIHPYGAYFDSLDKLKAEYPHPTVGQWAIIGQVCPFDIYVCYDDGNWTPLRKTNKEEIRQEISDVLLSRQYASLNNLQPYAKRDELVSYATKSELNSVRLIASASSSLQPHTHIPADVVGLYAMFDEYMTKSEFTAFTKQIYPVDKNGNAVNWTSPNISHIVCKPSLASLGDVSAFGIGESSGGGSTGGSASVDLLQSWDATETDGYALSANLGKELKGDLDSLSARLLNYQPKGDYALKSHNHDDKYSLLSHTHSQYLTSLPTHTHDDRYYTETEINSTLGSYATQSWVTGKGYLTSASSLAWSRLTGVPTTFTPSEHTHELELLKQYPVTHSGTTECHNIMGLQAYYDCQPDGAEDIGPYGVVVGLKSKYGPFLNLYYTSSPSNNNMRWGLQFRTGYNDTKRPWQTLLDSNNYSKFLNSAYTTKSEFAEYQTLISSKFTFNGNVVHIPNGLSTLNGLSADRITASESIKIGNAKLTYDATTKTLKVTGADGTSVSLSATGSVIALAEGSEASSGIYGGLTPVSPEIGGGVVAPTEGLQGRL